MRVMSVLVSDELAEQLETEARESNRDLAELAGEKLTAAVRPIDPRVLELLPFTPNTQLVNGRLLYVPPVEIPDWVAEIQPKNAAIDGTNGMHRVFGTLETPETEEELTRLLLEES